MNIPEVEESCRKYLKSRPQGGDTKAWICVRTVLDVLGRGSMGTRLHSIVEKLKPELNGSLLDVGCYGGWLYPLVRDRVTYTGIDEWPDAIEAAKSLFDANFILCELNRYREQHDIVWATQLHPTVDVGSIFPHLRSLARKMLVVTFGREGDIIEGGEVITYHGGVAAVYR